MTNIVLNAMNLRSEETVTVEEHKVELEEGGVRLKLTVVRILWRWWWSLSWLSWLSWWLRDKLGLNWLIIIRDHKNGTDDKKITSHWSQSVKNQSNSKSWKKDSPIHSKVKHFQLKVAYLRCIWVSTQKQFCQLGNIQEHETSLTIEEIALIQKFNSLWPRVIPPLVLCFEIHNVLFVSLQICVRRSHCWEFSIWQICGLAHCARWTICFAISLSMGWKRMMGQLLGLAY